MVPLAAQTIRNQVNPLAAESGMQVIADVASTATTLAHIYVVREISRRPLLRSYRHAADIADTVLGVGGKACRAGLVIFTPKVIHAQGAVARRTSPCRLDS